MKNFELIFKSILNACCKFVGSELCNRLSRYILTEEQLQENGYPRPDPENSSAAKVYTTSQQEQNSAKLKSKAKQSSQKFLRN